MLKLASYSVRQMPLLTIALAKLPHLPNSPLPGKPTESTEKSAVLGLSHFRRQSGWPQVKFAGSSAGQAWELNRQN
jgi:hypothetical protein